MNRGIFYWSLVKESSWNKIKQIVPKICSAAPILYFSTRGTAVQIWKAIRFFSFATIHLREVRHQYPWLVTGVFFHMYALRLSPNNPVFSFEQVVGFGTKTNNSNIIDCDNFKIIHALTIYSQTSKQNPTIYKVDFELRCIFQQNYSCVVRQNWWKYIL